MDAVELRMPRHVVVTVGDTVVVHSQIVVRIMHEAIPLRPALRVECDLIVVGHFPERLTVVDQFMFQPFPPKCWFANLVVPPVQLE